MECTINGKDFNIDTADNGLFFWEHIEEKTYVRGGVRQTIDMAIDEKSGFVTAAEAQADAMRYVRELEAAEADQQAEEEEDRRYGSYEQQARAGYSATRF